MIGIIIAAVLIAFVLLLIFLPAVAWSVLGFLIFALIFLLLIPVGLEISYLGSKFKLALKIWFYSHILFPKENKSSEAVYDAKKAEKTPLKKEVETPSGTGNKSKKLDLNFDETIEIAKKALRALGKIGKATVHKFTLHYIAAGKDPYSTAMTYNYVNAALSCLSPLCAKAFRLKGDLDVWTDIDFVRDKMQVDVELSITLRPVQLVYVALIAGFGLLEVLIKNKLRLSKEKRAINKQQKIKENIQTDERTDSDG